MLESRKVRRTFAEDDEAYVPDFQQSRRLPYKSTHVQQQSLEASRALARPSASQDAHDSLLDAHQLEQRQFMWDRQQQQQLDIVHAAVASLQQDAGRKRKQILELKSEVLHKQQRILSLEQCLQKYQDICACLVSQAQVMSEHSSTPTSFLRVASRKSFALHKCHDVH